VGNGKELSRFTEAGEISAVTFSPNGWQVATAGWDGTRVFETATGREVARVPGDSRDRGLMPGNSAVVFSPNGRFLASGNGDVQIVELPRVVEEDAHRVGDSYIGAAAFSANGHFIAIGGNDKTARIFNIESWNEVLNVAEGGQVDSVAISGDGQYIATNIVDPARGNKVAVFDAMSGKDISSLHSEFHTSSIAISGDGAHVVIGAADGAVRVFEIVSGREELKAEQEGQSNTVAFSADGRLIATGRNNGMVQVYEIRNGKELWHLFQDEPVYDVAFCGDRQHLIVRTSGTIATVDLTSGKRLWRSISPKPGLVHSLAISEDGHYAAVGGDYGEVSVFAAADGKELLRVTTGKPILAAHFDVQHDILLTASAEDILTYRNNLPNLVVARHLLRIQDLTNEACSRLTRNMTRAEWSRYVGINIPYDRTCPNLR
jgi:WD40 repeat protein